MGYRTRLTRPAKLDSETIPYNNARESGAPNTVAPPFRFTGVTMQVYPLRADLATLQSFIDTYLNNIFSCHDAGYFRAFTPYVYLMMVNYGKMSLSASNVGWLSQREFLFNIPLEWYVLQNGQLVFKDWAQVAPFIFVDNEMSITLGRQVYGWPKKLASLDTSDSGSWLGKPIGPHRRLALSTSVVHRLYMGERPADHVFLEMHENTLDSLYAGPPDWQGPYMPWMVTNHLASLGSAMGGDAMEFMRSARFHAQQPESAASNFARMGHGLMRMMDPAAPHVYFNCINLKQFRQASDPRLACYQAITNSVMRLDRMISGGLIGGGHQALADASGGIRIHLHSYDSLPIMKTLGLKAVQEWSSGDGHPVSVLRPVFPYWTEVDMTYGKGTTVVDRCIPVGKPHSPEVMKLREIRTNDGTVSQQLIGPLSFPNTTLRVLPLLATPEKLRTFCNDYLNNTLTPIQGGMQVHFEPWGHYVYLVALNNEDIVSTDNRESRLKDTEVTFYVPVLMYVKQPGDPAPQLNTVALLPVTSFSSDGTAASTASEVHGIPTTQARLSSPPSSWMQESGPSDATPTGFLDLKTLVFPALGQGQPAQLRRVLEILTGTPFAYNDDVNQRFVRENWEHQLRQDFQERWNYQDKTQGLAEPKQMPELQTAQALALEVLARKFPLNVITLKQIRGAEHPDHAVYQALLEFEYQFERVIDVREIEGDLLVRINDFSSERIVERLGLIPALFDPEGPDLVHTFQPVHPFWMKVSLQCSRGQPLLRRSGSTTWIPVHLKDGKRKGYFEADDTKQDTDRQQILELLSQFKAKNAGLGQHLLEAFQSWLEDTDRQQILELLKLFKSNDNTGPRQHLPEAVRSWLEKKGLKHEDKKLPIPDGDKTEEKLRLIPPQWLIESILSQEWQNWGNPRWLRQVRTDINNGPRPYFWLPYKYKPASEESPPGRYFYVPNRPESP